MIASTIRAAGYEADNPSVLTGSHELVKVATGFGDVENERSNESEEGDGVARNS